MRESFNKIRRRARVWDILLTLAFLPVLVTGASTIIEGYVRVDDGGKVLLGGLVGLLLSIFLRNVSYAAACVAYKRVSQSAFKRAHIKTAKIKANLFLTGLFLCLLKYQEFDSDFLIFAAIVNLWAAVLDIILNTIDGDEIMGELLGAPSLVENAKHTILNKIECRDVEEIAILLMSYIVMVFQVMIPLCIIVILGVWFV